MYWYLKALKQYANFRGRARRKEYGMFLLFHMIFTYGTVFISATLKLPALMIVVVIYVLATLIPGVAVAVRRMHDIGKSGWYILIPFYYLYLVCLDSEFEDNPYGPHPKRTPDAILQKV